MGFNLEQARRPDCAEQTALDIIELGKGSERGLGTETTAQESHI
jgi:hypothetical protein